MSRLSNYFSIKKNENITIYLTLLIGLVLRLLLIFYVTEPINKDAKQYYDIAKNISGGNGFSIDGVTPTLRRSPGYPFLLAGIIKVFGSTSTKYMYIFQAILNLISVYLVYLSLKKNSILPIIRIVATTLFCINTSFVYVNTLYATIPTIFFMALFVFLQVTDIQDKIKSIISGIIIGILILIRPTFLYLPFFLFLSIPLFVITRKNALIKKILLIGITSILMVTPWTIRNKIVIDKFIPLVSAGGRELWQANVEIQNRTVWYSVTNIQKYEDQRTQSSLIQKNLISKYLNSDNSLKDPEKLNHFLQNRGVEIIKSHPIRFLVLCFNRFLIFWFSPMIGATTIKSISSLLFWILLILKYILIIFTWPGLLLSKINERKFYFSIMIVVYLTLIHTAVHSIQRYFLPLLPITYFSIGYFFQSILNKSKG